MSEGLEREPANVYLLAASASIDAVETGRTRLTEAESAKRVALHMNRKFHYTILRPLFDVLLAEHWPLLTADGRELADFEPDVVLACDAQVRNLRSDTPDAVYVHVPHGLISKNHSLELARAADRVCATGPAHRESLIQGGVPKTTSGSPVTCSLTPCSGGSSRRFPSPSTPTVGRCCSLPPTTR